MCQDRTNDATSGRQKQPVYVTRVDVVQKQTLWNYQVRIGGGTTSVCELCELF
jgi:hypothetical protein